MRATLYHAMDDTQLWELLLQGDVSVLELLYQRNYDLLVNYGLRYTIDKELIKDCIHDVFVKLHQSKALSFAACPRSYLVRALRNALLDKLSALNEHIVLTEFVFQIPDSTDLFESVFRKGDEELELSKQLLEAISHLSDNQKNVLYLRFVKDFSYNEIAEVLEINVQSSMNVVSRSLKKLRTLLILNELSVFGFIFLVHLLYVSAHF